MNKKLAIHVTRKSMLTLTRFNPNPSMGYCTSRLYTARPETGKFLAFRTIITRSLSEAESMVARRIRWKKVEWEVHGIDTPLHLAVQKKNIPEIKRLINSGAKVNAPGRAGISPLFKAVETGKPALVDLLMSHGANAHQYETSSWNYNYTAYHYALLLKFYTITRLFIEKWNVPVDQSVAFHDYGWPPEAIEFAMPSRRGFKNMTPYKRAESEKILIYLLKNSETNFIRERERLYSEAVSYDMHEVVKLLKRE
jgi:hypothetical protein